MSASRSNSSRRKSPSRRSSSSRRTSPSRKSSSSKRTSPSRKSSSTSKNKTAKKAKVQKPAAKKPAAKKSTAKKLTAVASSVSSNLISNALKAAKSTVAKSNSTSKNKTTQKPAAKKLTAVASSVSSNLISNTLKAAKSTAAKSTAKKSTANILTAAVSSVSSNLISNTLKAAKSTAAKSTSKNTNTNKLTASLLSVSSNLISNTSKAISSKTIKSNNSISFKYTPTAGRNIQTTQDKAGNALTDLSKVKNILNNFPKKTTSALISTIEEVQKSINRTNSNLSKNAKKVSGAGSNVQIDIKNMAKKIGKIGNTMLKFGSSTVIASGSNIPTRNKLPSIRETSSSNNKNVSTSINIPFQVPDGIKKTAGYFVSDLLDVSKFVWKVTTDRKANLSLKIGILGGVYSGIGKVIDGGANLVGGGLDLSGNESAAAWLANFVKKEYVNNIQNSAIKKMNLDSNIINKANVIGESGLDLGVYVASTLYLSSGSRPVQALYTGLKDSGEVANEIYKHVDPNDAKLRKEAEKYSITAGVLTGTITFASGAEFITGPNLIANEVSAFVRGAVTSGSVGFSNFVIKNAAVEGATGKKADYDTSRLVASVIEASLFGGAASAASAHSMKITTKNIKHKDSQDYYEALRNSEETNSKTGYQAIDDAIEKIEENENTIKNNTKELEELNNENARLESEGKYKTAKNTKQRIKSIEKKNENLVKNNKSLIQSIDESVRDIEDIVKRNTILEYISNLGENIVNGSM